MTFHMHDRNDPDAVRLLNEDHRAGKTATEVPSGRGIESVKAFRVRPDFAEEPLYLLVKAHTQLRRDRRVGADSRGEFLVSLWVQPTVRRPASLRARASDSSSGTPWTLPDSISRSRRAISTSQAKVMAGSAPPYFAARIRSTSSATTSAGISRVASMISSIQTGTSSLCCGCRLLTRRKPARSKSSKGKRFSAWRRGQPERRAGRVHPFVLASSCHRGRRTPFQVPQAVGDASFPPSCGASQGPPPGSGGNLLVGFARARPGFDGHAFASPPSAFDSA